MSNGQQLQTQTAARLVSGDPAPMFVARCTSNERFHFDTVAGRYIVLCFFGSAAIPLSAATLKALLARRNVFDDLNASFFGVTCDAQDEKLGRVAQALPGVRFFWDHDNAVSRRYSVTASGEFRPTSFVLDERLRVVRVIRWSEDPEAHALEVHEVLQGLPSLGEDRPSIAVPAPCV
jgi:peroxiredoxin